MPKYKYNKINILFSCCLLVSFVVAPLVVQAQEDPLVTQAREAAKEAKPLVQELSRLKNQQQFEKVEQNFEKAQRFLEDNRPNQEHIVYKRSRRSPLILVGKRSFWILMK
nr:hypothetical protein [Histophilus somni]